MKITEGTKLGRYEVRSLIGVGGMGEVYRAFDPKIGREVAIKVLPADFSADKERVARFEQEAQAAGALNHPNIIAVYDVDTQDDALYVVSELLEGEELRQSSLVYADWSKSGVGNLFAQPISGGEPKKLTDFKNKLIFSFDYSRDGKQIAFSRGTNASDVLLYTNIK